MSEWGRGVCFVRLRFYVKTEGGYYPAGGRTVGTVTALSGVYGLTSGVMPADTDRFGGSSTYFIDSEWHTHLYMSKPDSIKNRSCSRLCRAYSKSYISS